MKIKAWAESGGLGSTRVLEKIEVGVNVISIENSILTGSDISSWTETGVWILYVWTGEYGMYLRDQKWTES